jgi:hypothetical protein
MQATTCFHDSIPKAILQEADDVLHDPVAFHPANGMFDPHTNRRKLLIQRLLRRGEFPTTRFFLGLNDRHPRQEASLEAFILIQTTPERQGIACHLRHAKSRRVAFTGRTQETNVTALIDHEEVFARVPLLLATVIFFLLFRILRPLDRPLRTLMPTREAVEDTSVLGLASSVANSSAVRAGRRSWSAKAWFSTVCKR